MIQRTLQYFHSPGEVIEICAIAPAVNKHALWEGFAGGKKGVVAGWFDDQELAAEVVAKLDGIGAEGIYHTLNPCMDALLSRSCNRLKAGVERTQDKEIFCLRWLLVDIDPRRVAGVSSTDHEHSHALECARDIGARLKERGWPDPLFGDSGNGAHLIYRLPDLPNDQGNVELLKLTLSTLAGLYNRTRDGAILEIDQKVFNAARISKLYGTTTRKGDRTAARPHREARIVEAPARVASVALDQLRALVGMVPAAGPGTPSRTAGEARQTAAGPGSRGRMDVGSYLQHYGVQVRKTKALGDGVMIILQQCVFDPSHSGGEAAICQAASGQLSYQCFHDSCKGRTWGDARRIISGEDRLGRFMPDYKPPGDACPSLDRNDKDKGKKKAQQPDQAPSGGVPPNVETRIDELNKRHAVLLLGGRCVVMDEHTEPVFQRPDLSFLSVVDFKNFYSNEKYWVPRGDGRPKQYDIGKLWLDSPNRRQYDGIAFHPGGPVNGYYNLFRGFGVKPQAGKWPLYSQHIFDVICDGNQELYNYVIAWLAHLFKFPGKERPGTSLVLRGRMGTGKGVFASQIGAILGSHYLHITHQKQLVGHFNNHLKDALFCFVDEGIWAGDKQAEGALKAMITEDKIAIEPKGKDVFMVHNFVRLLIATNNDWAIPAGLEERRFLVLDVSEKHMQDHRYFAALVKEMDNGGREAMLHDLLGLDISSVNLRSAPKTIGLLDQIVHSMSVAHKFWYECLSDGCLRSADPDWVEEDVPYHDVFKRYAAMAERLKEYRPHIPTTLVRELKKLCPGLRTVKRRNEYQRQITYLVVPSLEACRKSFEGLVQMPVPWGDGEIQKKQVVM